MAETWERTGPDPDGGRHPVLTAVGVVVAVVVVALLVRTEPSTEGGEQDLEVLSDGAAPDPAPGPTIVRRPPLATPTPEPSPSPGVDGEVAGSWLSEPAPAGAGAWEAALAWDGERRLFLLGGQRLQEDGRTWELLGVPWLYDAGVQRWEELPPPPLEARAGAAAAWVGSELVVWGGRGRSRMFADGAAFDPGAGAWRLLPEGPLSPRSGAVMVALDGARVVVAGGADNLGGRPEAALLDLGAGTWTAVAPLPDDVLQSSSLDGAASGGGPLVWPRDPWTPPPPAPLRLDGGTWVPTALPEQAEVPFGAHLQDDGSVVGLVGTPDRAGLLKASLLRLDGAGARWDPLADVPLEQHGGYLLTSLPGSRPVVLDVHGEAVALDPGSGRWSALPRMPGPHSGDTFSSRAYRTGDGFLLLEPSTSGEGGWRLHRFTLDEAG